jgi:hypothetical protein
MRNQQHQQSVNTSVHDLTRSGKDPQQNVDRQTIFSAASKTQQTSTEVARNVGNPSLPNAPRNPQIEYGIRLVLAVCHAEQVDQVRQAYRVLDKNPWRRKGSVSPESFQETVRQRKLRLLLRQRYMAAAATGVSTYDFSVALLNGWGVKNILPTFRRPKNTNKKKKKMKPMLKKEPVSSEHNHLNQISGSDGVAQSKPVPYENQNNIAADCARTKEATPPSMDKDSNNNIEVAMKTKANNLSKHRDGVSNTGQWNAEERKAFLLAFESYGVGYWAGIATYVPTR